MLIDRLKTSAVLISITAALLYLDANMSPTGRRGHLAIAATAVLCARELLGTLSVYLSNSGRPFGAHDIAGHRHHYTLCMPADDVAVVRIGIPTQLSQLENLAGS